MKKSIYVLFILLLVGFFFWGCSSTPEAVPEEEIVTVVPDAGESETVPSGDAFSDVNEKYLSAAAAARDSAIVAGADVLVPDIFTEIDAMYQQLCQVCADNPGQSQEAALIDVADRFTALERLVLAQNLRNKIGDLKFDNIDPQALADGDAAGEEAILLFESGGSGSDIRVAADKAFNAYNSIVLAGFKSLAEATRKEAYTQKDAADSIKSATADKDAYSATVLVLSAADAAFVSGNYEAAYTGFTETAVSFKEIYERVAEKRAAAEAAITRAKQKVDTTAVFAAEADEIAPLEAEGEMEE